MSSFCKPNTYTLKNVFFGLPRRTWLQTHQKKEGGTTPPSCESQTGGPLFVDRRDCAQLSKIHGSIRITSSF